MKKQVLVSVDRGETRVALLEATGTPAKGGRRRRRPARPAAGFRVAELYLERRGQRSIVGNIYKGRVDNVLAGLEAAFVDIGLEKNGFLHVDEIVLPGLEVPKRGRGHGDGRKITELIKPGQELVVQVVKDPLKTKGARLTMELTIAGRYMVYVPSGEGIGVSRRLDDKERDRLRKEAAHVTLEHGGAIVRTAAQGATRADFERELRYLHKLHEVLQSRVETTAAPAMVFQEADLAVRVVRDIATAEFDRAIIDDPKQHHRMISFFSRTAPELVDRVELYEEQDELFDRYGIEPVLDGTLSRRVDLPSGGYLMIDYAEALTVIDVNTGSFIGRGKSARLEDTITKTNLEAAEEVVRQLRLRDIGGIIVIDFIDMARARNRDAVLKTLRAALEEDRTKTFVVEISPLGLVEMTRQNVTDGVREIMTRPCPTCQGEGVIRSEETIAIEFERRLRQLARERSEPEAFLIQMNPRVAAQLTGNGARPLLALEQEVGKIFHFQGSEGLPLDHFAVVMEGPAGEIAERALPFRVGDEVLVEIVEPHMYNVDDAVAKIDSYIIAVTGAGALVGQKRLVRIEEVGRTAATATVVGGGSGAGDEAAEQPARPARRSRGGRGRGSRRTGAGADGSTEAGGEGAATDGARGADDGEPPRGADDGESPPAEPADAAGVAATPPQGDALQSQSRRRGRRGGKRQPSPSAAD